MDWRFEWDERKRSSNIRRHGIDFDDVCRVFGPDLLVQGDSRKDYGEVRFVGLGPLFGRLVVVVFTLRGKKVVRIISARKANRREQKIYEARAHEREEAGFDEGR